MLSLYLKIQGKNQAKLKKIKSNQFELVFILENRWFRFFFKINLIFFYKNQTELKKFILQFTDVPSRKVVEVKKKTQRHPNLQNEIKYT
jgi:ribosomal protein S18